MASIVEKFRCVLKETSLGKRYRKAKRDKSLLNEAVINKTIEKYVSNLSSAEKELIKKDIIDMAKKYSFSAEEYFYYHFKDKPEEERKTFISDLNRMEFCEKLNKEINREFFDNKAKCAEKFSKYYGRDICSVQSHDDFQKLKAFTDKHKKFILKPLVGSQGKGITILEKEWTDIEIEKLISDYCGDAKCGFIAEELVVQVPETGKFHPSSLNTIRMSTVRFDHEVKVIAAFLRTGRGGSIVDNAGAGGVFGTIDVATGIIDAAADEYGNNYEVHPDTGEKIVGFEIPRWNEAVALAKELATVVEGNRYAGWDLAITENGWIMIEGNAKGQFVWQIPRQKGYLKEANEMLKQLNLKEINKF